MTLKMSNYTTVQLIFFKGHEHIVFTKSLLKEVENHVLLLTQRITLQRMETKNLISAIVNGGAKA